MSGNRKFEQRFNNRAYIAVFSNVGCKDKKHFYLLMTFHCSRNGGFGEGISKSKCRDLVRKENLTYKFVEYPQGDMIE